MRADSWRVGTQGSTSSYRGATVFCGALALCAVLGAAGCAKSKYVNIGLDGGGGGTQDGGKDVPGAADAGQPNACSSGTLSKSKGKAESCSCDGECQTGLFCVDGLCCTSACGATCMACDLPSSLGDCSVVPSGVKPHDPLTCAASTPATCGQDGTCDGKGACRQYVKGTECKAGTCDGDSVTGILACDGNGKCSESSTLPCPPYSCDPASNHCALTCTTNAQCAAGQQCVAGSCGTKGIRQPCLTNAECTSGFCTDGVCCNLACSGLCVSCNQTGSVGFCTYIPAGLPDPACKASDRTTCGNTGLCDGLGSCTLYPENTVCGPSSCSGLVENTPRTCDGQGACRDPQLVDCSPFLCTSSACSQNCVSDADCEAGHQCVSQTINGVTSGTCGKKKPGQPCTGATECESGQCVDKVCCESACAGPCRSCSLASSPGRCLNVATGAPDPRNTCKDLGATSCSTDGVCDGNGACQTYPAGTVCGPQTCVAGLHTPASMCNASGQCAAPPSIQCNPYVCNGDVCYDSCTSSNIQCATGNVCTGASCGLKPPGAICGLGTECKSGFCAQGVCCNSACTGACMACNLSATAGLCTAVADNAPDPQGKCLVTQSNTCGTTGNCMKGICAYWSANCKPAVCAGTSTVTPASTCDGKGSCVTPPNQSCGTFQCSSAACKTTCTVATQGQDCVSPTTCVVTTSGVPSCGLKVNGATCTASNQCVSGFCTEGVCCENACSGAASGGLCKTCKATGTIAAGNCHDVPLGGSDPNSGCVKKADCTNDGTCNGNGACHPQVVGTVCGPESCTGTTHTFQATCNGSGTCQPPATSSCGDYVCSSTSPNCLSGCTHDTDCTNGTTCVLGQCGTKLGVGKTCVLPGDCSSGFCSPESVCCDQQCGGGCESCVTPNLGKCTPIGVGSPPRTTTPATCPTSGVCGNTGKCDGLDGCQQVAACNDGNPCTNKDVCTGGTCAGAPYTCTPDQCHQGGTCNGDGTCSFTNKTGSCNDGNPCTQNDVCTSGVCGGTAFSCAAPDQCHQAGTCNGDGTCSYANKANGTACNDANACTKTDVCTGGVCGGTSYTCTAADQCHQAGTCNGDGTCSFANKANGTACNDGIACTKTDVCTGGVCGGTSYTCAAPDQCHQAGTCNGDGTCSFANKADGTACNDGNACTTGDVCSGGTCVGGAAPNCDDGNVCTTDGCNPASGCTHTNNTAACNDGNACTTGDTCSGGACVGGAAPNCDDGNVCTTDGCNPATGCTHTNNTDSCSDGNACTTGDVCSGGTCVGGAAPNCDDGNVCTDDSCAPLSGCVHTNNTAPCDDGNACTTGDVCSAGTCTGTPVDCGGPACVPPTGCPI